MLSHNTAPTENTIPSRSAQQKNNENPSNVYPFAYAKSPTTPINTQSPRFTNSPKRITEKKKG